MNRTIFLIMFLIIVVFGILSIIFSDKAMGDHKSSLEEFEEDVKELNSMLKGGQIDGCYEGCKIRDQIAIKNNLTDKSGKLYVECIEKCDETFLGEK